MRRILVLLTLAACAPTGKHYDTIIRGGLVFDGTLSAPVIRDVAIRGDTIVTVDASTAATADNVVEAKGLIVTPGFIDPHTHALGGLLAASSSEGRNYLLQGVTTVFVGSDGGGIPVREVVFAKLTAQGIGTNVAFFAGHNLIRKATMGMANRNPTAEELLNMRQLIRTEMDAGAVGLSTGLFYAPGSYSTTNEIIELAKIVADKGGVYDSHIRSESSQNEGVVASIEEAIAIGDAAALPVHISHIKALGKDVWGQSENIVAVIDAARNDGIDVTANQYPWNASGTRFSNALIPRWVMADSNEKMSERLRDPAQRPRILEEMQANLILRGGPEAMLVTRIDSDYAGLNLREIATRLDMDLLDAAIHVVLTGDPSIASFVMDQGDIDTFAVQSWVMTGSDGTNGHPRLYGTYPKVWRDFVVDRKLMSAEQFVHRSSGLVAETFHLCKRGFLRDGYAADIAIIDPEQFRSNATYEAATEYTSGVVQVFVNGKATLNSNQTAVLSGEILKARTCN